MTEGSTCPTAPAGDSSNRPASTEFVGRALAVLDLRDRLTGPRTYYVATTGNDTTGDGSIGNPWATPQRAWTWCQTNLDLAGQVLTIKLTDGTYTGGFTFNPHGLMTGQTDHTSIIVEGNTANPSACVINGTLTAVRADFGALLRIKGLKLTGGVGLVSTEKSWVDYSYIDFGTCSAQHIANEKGGNTFDSGDVTISGDAPIHNYVIGGDSYAYETTGTTTLSGTRTFSTCYLYVSAGGFTGHTKAYPGTGVGKRFIGVDGAYIGAATQTILPGDAAGTLDDLSRYFAGDGSNTRDLYAGWTSISPTVSVPGGAITYTATGRYRVIGRVCFVEFEIVPTANTATNWWTLSLPGPPAPLHATTGFASWALTGPGGLCVIKAAGNGTANIVKASDGTVPTGTGTVTGQIFWDL